jgi:Tol biopolymer transport system component
MKLAALVAAALAVTVAVAGAAAGSKKNGRVLFTESNTYSEAYGSLYAINPDGTGRVLLSDQASNGSWSPDGKRILFDTSRKGDADLWTMNADGGGAKELTFSLGNDGDGARGRPTARRSCSSRTATMRRAPTSS